MAISGYIKLHRKIIDWEWYTDVNTKCLFFHLLIIANHTDKKWRGETIKKGECLTSYANLSVQTGLTVQQVRTSLKKLEKTGDVTIKTTNKNTVIMVVNYCLYQFEQQTNNTPNNNQVTNEQQSSNNQVTTTKNDKNYKNVKNDNKEDIEIVVPYKKIVDLYNSICTNLSKVVSVTENRKTHIAARYKDYKCDISVFEKLFTMTNESYFLCNGTPDRKWKANFDWLMNEQNMAKVLEGNYVNGDSSGDNSQRNESYGTKDKYERWLEDD